MYEANNENDGTVIAVSKRFHQENVTRLESQSTTTSIDIKVVNENVAPSIILLSRRGFFLDAKFPAVD